MIPFRPQIIRWISTAVTVLAVLISLPVVWMQFQLQAAKGAVNRQRQAAKSENIPVMAADLKRNPPVPERDNAAPFYTTLSDQYTKHKDKWDQASKPAMRIVGTQEQQGDAKIARKLLADSVNVLALLEKALARPDCDFSRQWEKGADVELPELSAMRHAARLLAIKAELLDRDGKPNEALKQIEKGSKLAQHSNADKCLISLLVQIALERILEREWHQLVNRHADNPTFLDRAARADTAFGKLPSLNAATRREIGIVLLIIDGAREGKSKPVDEIPSDVADVYQQHWIGFGRKAILAIANANHNPAQMIKALEPIIREEERAAKSNPLRQFNRDMVPPFLSAAKQLARLDALRRMRKLKLELLHYRLNHKTFPADLSTFDSKLTTDPFTGTTLHYVREAKGYRLWSVGEDGKNDGGAKPSDASKAKDVVTYFP
jgi:hypothetical protein